MTEADVLLADIIANPDDDAPRLIYAGWLGEHGDEARAEFIRTQVELAELRKRIEAYPGRAAKNGVGVGLRDRRLKAIYNAAAALRRRERELVEKYGTAWIAELLGGR